MTTDLKTFLVNNPVDRELVEEHKTRMLAEMRTYRLRELRKAAGLTQEQVATRIGVSQRQVSKIERGDLDSTKIGTIRGYIEALGGSLAIEFMEGDDRILIT